MPKHTSRKCAASPAIRLRQIREAGVAAQERQSCSVSSARLALAAAARAVTRCLRPARDRVVDSENVSPGDEDSSPQ